MKEKGRNKVLGKSAKTKSTKKPEGRPTKYTKDTPQDMINYFKRCKQEIYVDQSFYSISATQLKMMEKQGKDVTEEMQGSLKSIFHKLIKDTCPTFQRYAANIGVHIDTLHEWKDKYKEFSEAYRICKQIQEAILVENGLQGLYNPQFTMFLLKNNHGYKDKQEVEMGGKLDITAITQMTDAELISQLNK